MSQAICWDGQTRDVLNSDVQVIGSTASSEPSVRVDGELVLVYTRLVNGVLYAVSREEATRRAWSWTVPVRLMAEHA